MRRDEKEVLEQAATLLWTKEIGPDEFLRRTRGVWRTMSAGIYARYRRRLPEWGERDDVDQVLMMNALKYVRRWRFDKGATISTVVGFCCLHRTQRQCDKWRGASTTGNSGKNPGRTETTFSKIDGSRAEEPQEDFGSRQPAPEDDIGELIDSADDFDEALDRCTTTRQALVTIALRATRGDVDAAADLLFRNTRSRSECGLLRDVRHAARVVRSVLEEIEPVVERVSPPADLFDPLEESAATEVA